jgi:hypothetical protein
MPVRSQIDYHCQMRLLAGVLVLVLASSPAHAEDPTWQGVFVGSTSVAFVGAAFAWYGMNQVDHAEEQLCTGNYATDCGHAPPTTQAEIDHLNENGERGSTIAWVGTGLFVAGGALAVVAAYKGFSGGTKQEPAVAIAPVITREGAGASLQLRW